MSTVVGTEHRLGDLVEIARSRVASGERYVLGITGAPGAGKSTLAEALHAALGPQVSALVGMDGFHLANQVLVDLDRVDRKGAFDTFDVAGYTSLLQAITRQRSMEPVDGEQPIIYAPVFRREIEEPIGSAVPVRAEVPLVITEGNYLLLDRGGWPAAARYIDEVWFLAVDTATRVERLVNRHRQFGRGPVEAVEWAEGPDQVNSEMIEDTASAADLVVTLVERP